MLTATVPLLLSWDAPSCFCLENEIKTTVRSRQMESDKLLVVTKLGVPRAQEACGPHSRSVSLNISLNNPGMSGVALSVTHKTWAIARGINN